MLGAHFALIFLGGIYVDCSFNPAGERGGGRGHSHTSPVALGGKPANGHTDAGGLADGRFLDVR